MVKKQQASPVIDFWLASLLLVLLNGNVYLLELLNGNVYLLELLNGNVYLLELLNGNVYLLVKQQFVERHVTPLGYIILIPSQPIFALSP
jgi:hypothetical protein